MIVVSDDDWSVTSLIDIARAHNRGVSVRETVVKALLGVLKSCKLTNDEKDFCFSVEEKMSKRKDFAESRAMYYWRNCIERIILMVVKGIEYRTIDEKRRSFLSMGSFNRFNPQHKNTLSSMNHKAYDAIRRKGDFVRNHMNISVENIAARGFDALMKIDEKKQPSAIDMQKTIDYERFGRKGHGDKRRTGKPEKKGKGKKGKSSSGR